MVFFFFFPNNVIYIIIQVIKSYGLFSMYNCCFLIILSPFFSLSICISQLLAH